MPAKVILRVVAGPIRGAEFVFEQHDTFIFGRHRDCHARLPSDARVSRHQFLLEVNPPAIRIRDLGSRNGTRVNGTKYGGRAPSESPEQAAHHTYPEVDLTHGDQITVGDTTICVQVELPVRCQLCGLEIPDFHRLTTDELPGSPTCEACRVERAAQPPRVTIVEPPVCARCGKVVSDELQPGGAADYYCKDCQTNLLAGGDPLRHLLRAAVGDDVRQRRLLELDEYELGDELGKGGQGVVYQATRKMDRQQVAIKVMLPKIAVDEPARKRFLREIDVITQLRHEHIVPLLDRGAAGAVFYYVMEYCRGGSVSHLKRRKGGQLSLALASRIIMQCLDGLDYMHRAGYVHRDLKPDNVLLSGSGKRWKAKITDFGLAKLFVESGWSGFTATNVFAGTYHYMPREQLTQFREFRPISDLWSLAAMYYHMLTGCLPREFPLNRDRVEVVLYDNAVPIRQRDPTVPNRLAYVIDRALVTDPEKRFQTAAELKQALSEALPERSS